MIILMMGWYAGSVDHVDFPNKESCMEAAEFVKQNLNGSSRVLCVYRGEAK